MRLEAKIFPIEKSPMTLRKRSVECGIRYTGQIYDQHGNGSVYQLHFLEPERWINHFVAVDEIRWANPVYKTTKDTSVLISKLDRGLHWHKAFITQCYALLSAVNPGLMEIGVHWLDGTDHQISAYLKNSHWYGAT